MLSFVTDQTARPLYFVHISARISPKYLECRFTPVEFVVVAGSILPSTLLVDWTGLNRIRTQV
jgi:hypothetical protein